MQNKIKIGDQIVCWQSSCVINQQGEHKLEPLALAFLKFLSEHQGQVVSRAQLLQAVWHNREVSDDAIRRVVRMLRTALGDDAKSPRYIKTLPLQGYMLLPPIIAVDDLITNKPAVIKKSLLLNRPTFFFMGFIFVLVIIAALFMMQESSLQTKFAQVPHIEKLTSLSGAQSQGEYCSVNNTLLFVHRANSDEPLALYSKNLTTQTVKRLTFGDENIYFAKFSPNCQQLAYTVQQGQSKTTYLANYTKKGLANIVSLIDNDKVNDSESKALLSWSADGLSLYFSTKRLAVNNSGGMSADINNSAVISRFILQSNNWEQVTFSLVGGGGDYLAQESLDGRYLAVLRNTIGRRISLLVLDLETQAITVERHLPFYPSKLVWLNDDSVSLALSSVKGNFFYYNILHNVLQEQEGSNITLTDVFSHCGDKCFFMRKHDVNYADIKEIPNPFIPNINIAAVHIESKGADFNPVYSQDGEAIYFTNKHEDIVMLMRKTSLGKDEVFFNFDPRKAIHNLQIGPNEKYAIGKLESRIFVLDLETKDIQFITAQQEQAFYPLFSQDGKQIYFSRLEQDKVVLQAYDLKQQKVMTIIEGFYARFESNSSKVYLLSSDYGLYKQLTNGQQQFIVQLGRNPYYDWQVFDNFVYFTKANGSDVEMHRFDMISGKLEKIRLSKNSKRFHFRVHPSGNKILVVESILSNSELVKVTWQ